jgi:hypothetical protein
MQSVILSVPIFLDTLSQTVALSASLHFALPRANKFEKLEMM